MGFVSDKEKCIAAEEASAAGIAWTFAPMIDIVRDARWGRVMEGAGEDTYLGALIAEAKVKGFQGNHWKDLYNTNTILACAKHFCAYGAAESGRDYNTVDVSDRTLREVYFPPFKGCRCSNIYDRIQRNKWHSLHCQQISFSGCIKG